MTSSSSPKTMLSGFNHNVKYQGSVYHVQTEDSGLGAPHVITLLYINGDILARTKTSYAEMVGQENFERDLQQLMQEQHKDMLRDLIHGKYDATIAAHAGHKAAPAADTGPHPAAPPQPEAAAVTDQAVPIAQSQAAEQTTAATGAKDGPSALPPPIPTPRFAAAGTLLTGPAQPKLTPSLGPPPRAPAPVSAQKPTAATPESPAAAGAGAGPAPQQADAAAAVPVDGSIFGGLISEKSFDEVILSYLEDDKKK